MHVEIPTTALLIVVDDWCPPTPTPVRVDMRYDPADPYAVTFLLANDTNEARWTFARDLLFEGMDRCEDHPAGYSDVRVWQHPDGILLRLSSPEGTATFLLNRPDVRKFVRRTQVLVPRGTEERHVDWESEINALLARG